MSGDNDNTRAEVGEDLATRAPQPDDPAVHVGADGDPLAKGTRMGERESYERVIEGLKIAADAAAHLAIHEMLNQANWNARMGFLDRARKAAIKHAGIEDPIGANETEKVRRNPLPWRQARERYRDGLRQAAGGMRQLATCFRSDLTWLKMAMTIEEMIRRLTKVSVSRARQSSIILPPGYARG